VSWQSAGACVGMPADIWFEPIPSYQSRARFVCSLCPVVGPCVREAIRNGDRGIRGGLTYAERAGGMRMPVIHEVRQMAYDLKVKAS
jgi:hypothetical protein